MSLLKISALPALIMSVLFVVLMPLNALAQSDKSDAATKQSIKFGLLPHLSSQVTITKYKPLIDYLKTSLKRPIAVVTAPDFKTFVHRAENGDFDFYLTAPNLAAYHEKHNKHIRLAKFTANLQGVFVVAKDSPYRSLSDLKGKVMATPDIMAVITSLGELTLTENGIVPGKDIRLMYTHSHNDALQSVINNKADAAVMGHPSYRILTSRGQLRKPVRIILKTKTIPHLMFMCPDTNNAAQCEQFKSVLLKFTADGPGKEFYSGLPNRGIDLISDKDMQNLNGLLRLLEQRLKN